MIITPIRIIYLAEFSSNSDAPDHTQCHAVDSFRHDLRYFAMPPAASALGRFEGVRRFCSCQARRFSPDGSSSVTTALSPRALRTGYVGSLAVYRHRRSAIRDARICSALESARREAIAFWLGSMACRRRYAIFAASCRRPIRRRGRHRFCRPAMML